MDKIVPKTQGAPKIAITTLHYHPLPQQMAG